MTRIALGALLAASWVAVGAAPGCARRALTWYGSADGASRLNGARMLAVVSDVTPA